MIPAFTANFNLDSESDDFQKIVLTDTTDWVAEGFLLAQMRGWFRITYPDGTVRTGSAADLDINWSIPISEASIDMATVTGGGVQVGVYEIEFTAFTTFAPGVLFTASKTIDFQPYDGVFDCGTGKVKDPTYTILVDCNSLVITGKNTTDFGSFESVSHSTTLHFPAEAETADLVVASILVESSFEWNFAAYEFIFNSLATYALGADGTCTITIRVKKSVPKIVECDVDLCATVECYRQFTDQLLEEASLMGGYHHLEAAKLIALNKANTYFTRITTLHRCGLYAEAAEDAAALEKILKVYVAGCNCVCKNDGSPQRITLPTSGPGTLSFSADSPLSVSVVDGVVTYSLDPAFVSAVSSIVATALSSSDDSVGLSSSMAGGTITWDLVGRQQLDFQLRLQYSTYPLAFTFTEVQARGNRWNTDALAARTLGDHVSLAEFEALMAEFVISGYATSLMAITDKINVAILEAKPRNFATRDVGSLIRLEMIGDQPLEGNSRIGFRFVDAVDGLPLSMNRFIADINYVDLHIQIAK